MKKLYIEATSRCNLKCKMCFRNSWIDEKTADMKRETFDKIMEAAGQSDEIRTIMFAGMGEPLLHHDICYMVASVKQAGKRAEILTNAFLLDKNMTDSLLYNKLDRLWVSVDGFSKESYERMQRGSDFEKINENISYFAKRRDSCSIGFTFVVMEDNFSELNSINAFANKFSAEEINISYCIPTVPTEESKTLYDSEIPIGKAYRLENRKKRTLNLCPFIDEDVCFVKQNGDVCPCMQLLHSSYTYLFKEKRRITASPFGNVNKENLLDIYNSAAYKEFRNRVKYFEFPDCTLCDGCDDRLENKKDCMFNSFPTCGACLWAQGAARCP